MRYRRRSARAELRIRTANGKATQEPVTPAFVNAVKVYPFGDGVLYQLFAAPERIADIALQPGENKRVHILVKPFAAGLSTNLVITTDRR